jgi:hypothetical protein
MVMWREMEPFIQEGVLLCDPTLYLLVRLYRRQQLGNKWALSEYIATAVCSA